MAQDLVSSFSRKLAYVPGPTFGFVKLLASSGSHCTKWADEQHRPAGFESWLVPDLPLPFFPTLISLRAFDYMSSRVWWEAATNIGTFFAEFTRGKNPRLFVIAFASPPLLLVDSTPFFLPIALLQGWVPLLVVDLFSFFCIDMHWRLHLSVRPRSAKGTG